MAVALVWCSRVLGFVIRSFPTRAVRMRALWLTSFIPDGPGRTHPALAWRTRKAHLLRTTHPSLAALNSHNPLLCCTHPTPCCAYPTSPPAVLHPTHPLLRVTHPTLPSSQGTGCAPGGCPPWSLRSSWALATVCQRGELHVNARPCLGRSGNCHTSCQAKNPYGTHLVCRLHTAAATCRCSAACPRPTTTSTCCRTVTALLLLDYLRPVLNICDVVLALLRLRANGGDWADALDAAIPRRKRAAGSAGAGSAGAGAAVAAEGRGPRSAPPPASAAALAAVTPDQ